MMNLVWKCEDSGTRDSELMMNFQEFKDIDPPDRKIMWTILSFLKGKSPIKLLKN